MPPTAAMSMRWTTCALGGSIEGEASADDEEAGAGSQGKDNQVRHHASHNTGLPGACGPDCAIYR